jgi:hypothetical protein
MLTFTGMIWSHSLLLRNIEYNDTNLNRSSLIFQTQALNSLYTLLNCPFQILEQLYTLYMPRSALTNLDFSDPLNQGLHVHTCPFIEA